MKKKLYIIPLFLTLFSFVVIYLSLQLDTSPEMIVGDSMQARSFPIFLMVINLLLVGILSLQFYKTYPKEIELEKFPTWSSMLLFVIFYIIILISGDMFVAIPIVMFLMGLTWGQKKVWVSLTNAIVTILFVSWLIQYLSKFLDIETLSPLNTCCEKRASTNETSSLTFTAITDVRFLLIESKFSLKPSHLSILGATLYTFPGSLLVTESEKFTIISSKLPSA